MIRIINQWHNVRVCDCGRVKLFYSELWHVGISLWFSASISIYIMKMFLIFFSFALFIGACSEFHIKGNKEQKHNNNKYTIYLLKKWTHFHYIIHFYCPCWCFQCSSSLSRFMYIWCTEQHDTVELKLLLFQKWKVKYFNSNLKYCVDF